MAPLTTTTTATPTTTTAPTITTTTATPTTTTVKQTTITTTPPTTTTTAPSTTITTTTTAVAVVRAPVVVLSAVLVRPFVPQLENRTSPEFKALAADVVLVYEVIYRARYGLLFSRVIVIAFRQAGTRTRTDPSTEAEVEVVFNNTITPAEIPEAKDVQQTLVTAVSNPNNTFNLTFDKASVVATQVNIFTKLLQFTSVGETFTADLLNSSSQAFINRASLIVTTLEPIYNKTFSSYLSMNVAGFRNGSIISNIDIRFASTSAPNNTDIANVLINAAPNITAFTITNVVGSDPVASITTASTTTPVMTAATNATTANITNITPGTNTTTLLTTASTTTANTTAPMMTTPTNATTANLTNTTHSTHTTTVSTAASTTPVNTTTPMITTPTNSTTANLTNTTPVTNTTTVSTTASTTAVNATASTTASNATTANLTNITPGTNTTTVSTAASTTPVNTTTPMITTPTNSTTANLTNTTPVTNTTTVSTTASTTAVNATASTTASNATTANLTNITPGTNTTTVSTTTGSAVATTTTSSTTAPTTTTTAAVVAVVRTPIVVVAAVLLQPFVPELQDKNSPEFKALEEQVVVVYEIIYRREYGSLFSRVIVIAFRKAGTRTRASTTGNNIEAEVQVVFNSTITPAQIPEAKDVQQTLVNAVSNPNNTFNLSIDNTSVIATQVNIFTKLLQFTSVGETFTADLLNSSSPAFRNRSSLIVTTLEPIYNKTFSSYLSMNVAEFRNGSIITDIYIRFASTSAPNDTDIANVLINAAPNITAFNITNVVVSDPVTVTNTATPTTTTTAANTTATTPTTTTAVTTTTAEPVRTLAVQFRSVNGIFTTDLLTSSSTAFQKRASLIKTSLEPFYQARFPSFRFINVTAFSNGSIINNMDIGFALSLVPNANQIAQVLIDAAKITPFDIETSSILVDGTPSHGVSHKISLLTASCMLLLSWFLSGQQ
ncbi:uncharacterized threonine-rich GPI-anchored glycoprotein PJ4664.02 [Oreochromis niloticus]|uniref:uncharacterized threonine-rich GPI-anchored glycoprotein PJ4664.02 n=2 Tax=Oreochromis TaxID=8139 RepID=UPI0009051B95|nr:uncharacterized threonine-rich GPI-anchored glycoprotein PJ4664.02 [Oreochromis niloticus]